jgi:hypothetical protein
MDAATRNQPPFGDDAGKAGQVVASYDSYTAAEHAVDGLADSGFPVENSEIVGRELRLVEQVTGRITTWRAIWAGIGTGAWIGLLIGLLLGLFTTRSTWFAIVASAVLIGAVWGLIFALIARGMTHGRRDFSSESQIVAGRYDLTVTDEFADRAREMLSHAA